MAVDALTSTAMEFTVDSSCHSPYITAPSSPKHLEDFICSSVPATLTRVSASSELSESSSAIPFSWEEKPGKPKAIGAEDDFAFDFSGHLESAFLSADELFDSGVIRPLKPPPRLQLSSEPNHKSSVISPRESFSLRKKMFRTAFSSRESIDFDPFEAAIESTRKAAASSKDQNHHKNIKASSLIGSSCSSYSFRSHRKWRLKDLLLFWGSASGKDEDTKSASFRSSDGSGSVWERRFAGDQAGSEELKRKRGLLGCMGFNNTVHGLVKGMETVSRG